MCLSLIFIFLASLAVNFRIYAGFSSKISFNRRTREIGLSAPRLTHVPSHRGRSLHMRKNSVNKEVEFKIVSFNILAPCYRKVEEVTGGMNKAYFEMERPEEYMQRNRKIIDQLLDSNADIICLQEFWSRNEELQSLYVTRLCEDRTTL